MKRHAFVWLAVVPFAGLLACSNNNPSKRLENAQSDVNSANKEVAKGQTDIDKNKPESAQEHFNKANEERAKANEEIGLAKRTGAQTSERLPVAGHELAMGSQLRDKLGKDWSCEQEGNDFVCNKLKNTKRADEKIVKKVLDNIGSLEKDHPDMKAFWDRHEGSVTMSGQIPDCSDAASTANDFAKIDGVNRIVVRVVCAK